MCPIHHLSVKSNRSKSRLRLATTRTKVFVWVNGDDEIKKAFGFVADFSETGVGIYCSDKMAKNIGLRIAIETEEGESFRGTVIWCNRYSLEQHFVGHKAMSYRVGIKLIFSSEAERQRYVKYYMDLQKRAMAVRPGMVF